MKNILLVHNYYQIPGGEDTVVKNEKELLEKHGHKVVLYKRSNDEIKQMNLLGKLFLPFTAIFSLKTYREVKRLIKAEEIDVVHVHNTLTMVSPSVFCAASASKVPVVQTLHNFRMICPNGLFFCNGKVCEKCLEKGIGHALKNSCYRNSKVQTLIVVMTMMFHRMIGTYKKANYICLTDFNKEKILAKNKKNSFVKPGSVFVKPNFTYYKADSDVLTKRKKQGVFVGRIEEIKGIESLLEAWKDIKDVDLVMCGTGPLESMAKEYCKKNNMTNVHMLGFTAHDEVMKIISESEFLILSSLLYEGFPMTITESLACGTPVLCSDIGNLGSLVKPDFNGYKFKPGDAEDIRSVVGQMINCDHKEEMYHNCRNCFAENYSEEANYQILREIYNKLR